MKRIKYIDLFAGCGGLSDGFEKTGKYKFVAGVEWDKRASQTFIHRLNTKWNYGNVQEALMRFDIQKIKELRSGWDNCGEYESSKGLDYFVRKAKGVDLIIGGPPCQAYSIAGRIRDEHGMRYDYRNYLFDSYIDIVKTYKSKAFVFENVPGMLSASPGGIPIVERIRRAFDVAGYEIVDNLKGNAVLDLTEYGVPQRRSRVIIIGIKKSHFRNNRQNILLNFYHNILAELKATKKVTVEQSISDLMPFYPSKEYRCSGRNFSHTPSENTFQGHSPRYHNKRDVSIFRELACDVLNGCRKYKTTEDLKELYYKKTGKTANVHKYYVLRWDDQSNTIPAHLYKDGLRHIHPDPEQARSLTVREAARLQTFDDNYVFLGSMGDQYKMIGNAVPPLFAKKLSLAIYEFMKLYLIRD